MIGQQHRFLYAVLAVLTVSGCAQMMGSLRRDFDDSDSYSYNAPTIGGRWTERNTLGDEMIQPSVYEDHYSSVGHAERSPAGYGLKQPASARRSWLDDNSNQNEENPESLADQSYSNTPSLPPSTRRLYKNGTRATRGDFIDETPNEGSLWASDGQTNYYFTKNKIRGVGDIVSVVVEADLYRDAVLEVTRSLNSNEREAELKLAQERIRAKTLGLPDPDAPVKQDQLGSSSAAASRAPAGAPAADTSAASADKSAEERVRSATMADIDVSRSLQFKAGEQIMTEIVERYPNGNYKIRGSKRIAYRNGSRMLAMVGVVKGTDIGEDDGVTSGKLYEYRLEVVR